MDGLINLDFCVKLHPEVLDHPSIFFKCYSGFCNIRRQFVFKVKVTKLNDRRVSEEMFEVKYRVTFVFKNGFTNKVI